MGADIALAHGGALGQGHGGHLGPRLGGGVEGQLNHAHLWAVAVADDDLMALLDEADEGGGRLVEAGHLLPRCIPQGVAPQGDDDA